MLLMKVMLAPLLVVGCALAGRRWGPRVAGTLVALPVVAGPILLITRLEHGAEFGARAAEASLLGLVSLVLFAVVFAHVSQRAGWVLTLAISWGAVLAADVGLAELRVPAAPGLVLVLAATAIAAQLLPRQANARIIWPLAPPWWDLPGRALATGLLVLVVSGAAAGLGPSRTGVLAPFPIAASVVVAFVLAQHGPHATVETLRGLLRGLVGFATFVFVVAVLTPRATTWVTFGAALLTALAVQAIATVSVARRPAQRVL